MFWSRQAKRSGTLIFLWLKVVELEDLTRFDKVFYVSAESEYGIDELRRYIETLAKESPEAKAEIEGLEHCKLVS